MNKLTMKNANFSGSIGATVSGPPARTLPAAVRYLLPLTLSIALTGIAFAGPKLAPDLKGKAGDMMDVIVQFKNPPTKEQLKQLGAYGRLKKIFNGINAAHLTLPMSVIAAIENDPTITYISPNRPTAGSLDVVDPTVNATFAWQYGFDGTGIGVAIVDSGVSLKRDLLNRDNLSTRVVYSESFVAGEDPSDLYGHGTHVAGIVGGSGADSTGATFTRTFSGVAPNVSIINLKVLDVNGAGYESDVISGIQRAIQLKDTYNIRVLNLSLGRPIYESYKLDPLCLAVEQAWKAGIVVVVAAGNYGRDDNRRTKGYGTIASPGNDPYVITVGATTTAQFRGWMTRSLPSAPKVQRPSITLSSRT
jgi:serine protease AprX